MPRFSSKDREIGDGPWPQGLNDASDSRFLEEGQVPRLIDCDVTLAGGLFKRKGLHWLAGIPENDRAVCVLIEFLHDGRVVLGIMYPNTTADVFDSPNARFKLYALPLKSFITDGSITAAIESSVMTLETTSDRYTFPTVVRTGGRTYIACHGNIAKWDGTSWTIIEHDDTAGASEKTWDTNMFGYWTRKTFDGVPTAVSDIRTADFEREEPITPSVTLRSDDKEGGGGFPKSDLIHLYQVGDRQVVLSAYGDKVRYSFPTPYGAGVSDADTAVYGPQDWLEEAWLDLGEASSFDYVTAFIQVSEVLYVFKRSSIWSIYGDLAPGGLRVQKLHDGIGTRHQRLVAAAGSGVVFFDLNTASLWLLEGESLTDLWNQRILVDLDSTSNDQSWVFNSFVTVYHNRIYASLPTDGTPKMRTYVTDLTTGAVLLWSYGASYFAPVEFYGNYGMVAAPRITDVDNDQEPGEGGNDPSFFAWVEDTSRTGVTLPNHDQLSQTDTRAFSAEMDTMSLVPSLSTESQQGDWSSVNPKWRRGLATVSCDMSSDMTVAFNGVEQTVHIPASEPPVQVWVPLPAIPQSSTMEVSVTLPDCVTLHRMAMRYWRRR